MRRLITAVNEAAEKSKKKKAAACPQPNGPSRFVMIKRTIIGEPLNYVVPTDERYLSNGLPRISFTPIPSAVGKRSKSKSKSKSKSNSTSKKSGSSKSKSK